MIGSHVVKKSFPVHPDTAVFTTTFVALQKGTITRVTHDIDDGSWQFHTNDMFESYREIAMIVGLQEILDMDPSILEIADMPAGFSATRADRNAPWKIIRQSKTM